MKQERMKILELLDQGKITATEAANLLEALKASDNQERVWDDEAKRSVQEKVNRFSQNVEGLSKDIGDKLEATFKDMEPKLRTVTKVVVEKTAAIVDEISKSLNETLKNLEERRAKEGCCCEEDKEETQCEVEPEDDSCCNTECTETEDKPAEN